MAPAGFVERHWPKMAVALVLTFASGICFGPRRYHGISWRLLLFHCTPGPVRPFSSGIVSSPGTGWIYLPRPILEQQARFERFCAALTDDIRANAYRAAIRAGYTLRMAKSKSYKLARRAWPRIRSAWLRKHFAPAVMAEKRRRYYQDRRNRREALGMARLAGKTRGGVKGRIFRGFEKATVPQFVPTLDQKPSQLVAMRRGTNRAATRSIL
jgi:hypothetical protein